MRITKVFVAHQLDGRRSSAMQTFVVQLECCGTCVRTCVPSCARIIRIIDTLGIGIISRTHAITFALWFHQTIVLYCIKFDCIILYIVLYIIEYVVLYYCCFVFLLAKFVRTWGLLFLQEDEVPDATRRCSWRPDVCQPGNAKWFELGLHMWVTSCHRVSSFASFCLDSAMPCTQTPETMCEECFCRIFSKLVPLVCGTDCVWFSLIWYWRPSIYSWFAHWTLLNWS